MKALAELGMSEEEYRAIQMAVYKTAWASDVEKDSGRMPAEAVSESMSEAVKGHARRDARGPRGRAEAGRARQRARCPTTTSKKLQEEMARLGQDAAKVLDVPKANVELFRKHEAEIKKYAMNALAYVGL